MNDRQAYALVNPANDPTSTLNPALRSVRKHAKGWHIMTILAVDR